MMCFNFLCKPVQNCVLCCGSSVCADVFLAFCLSLAASPFGLGSSLILVNFVFACVPFFPFLLGVFVPCFVYCIFACLVCCCGFPRVDAFLIVSLQLLAFAFGVRVESIPEKLFLGFGTFSYSSFAVS